MFERLIHTIISGSSIRVRLTTAFLGLATIPLLTVGIFLIWQSFQVQREQAESLQRELASRVADQTEVLILTAERELDSLGRRIELVNYRTEDVGVELSKVLSTGDVFEELFLIDSFGQEIAGASLYSIIIEQDLRDRSDSLEFKVPSKERTSYFGPILFASNTGEPLMTISVPMINARTEEIESIVAGKLRLKVIRDLVGELKIGERGMAYIVDQDSRVVAHKNPAFVLRETQFVVPSEDGITLGLNGDLVVLASHMIELNTQKLFVVAEKPISEALSLTFRSLLTIAGVLILAAITASVLVMVTVRQLVKPIQELANTADEISSGRLSERVHITSNDELATLANAFNSMTDQLEDTINSLQLRVSERDEEIEERKRAENEQLRLQEALSHQVEELRESRQRIVNAEESVRRDIAELLHSTVQTRLVVAWHKLNQSSNLLEKGSSDAAINILKQVTDEIDEIRENEVRRASHLLHPSIISLGLLPAIQSLNSTFEGTFKMAVSVDPIVAELDDPVENRIPEAIRLVAYRVIEEALINISRHAQATQVEISLGIKEDNFLEVWIQDNGVGFNLATLKKGLGLTSISDRVGAVEGSWDINGELGKGTLLSTLLPLEDQQGETAN